MKTAFHLRRSAPLALVLVALAGCGGADTKDKAALDQIDKRLADNGNADPAARRALQDQIMVDPNLTQQANQHAIRPTDAPFDAPMPPEAQGPASKPGETLGTRAAAQAGAAKDRFAGCALEVSYSFQYANRLPADLPIYPKAHVSEAAGSDNANCQLRAVTYASVASPRALVDYHLALAKKAGYAATSGPGDGGTLVSATRNSDGAAFYVTIKPEGSGASADLVSNRGR
jgi:hypothetical protein